MVILSSNPRREYVYSSYDQEQKIIELQSQDIPLAGLDVSQTAHSDTILIVKHTALVCS